MPGSDFEFLAEPLAAALRQGCSSPLEFGVGSPAFRVGDLSEICGGGDGAEECQHAYWQYLGELLADCPVPPPEAERSQVRVRQEDGQLIEPW